MHLFRVYLSSCCVVNALFPICGVPAPCLTVFQPCWSSPWSRCIASGLRHSVTPSAPEDHGSPMHWMYTSERCKQHGRLPPVLLAARTARRFFSVVPRVRNDPNKYCGACAALNVLLIRRLHWSCEASCPTEIWSTKVRCSSWAVVRSGEMTCVIISRRGVVDLSRTQICSLAFCWAGSRHNSAFSVSPLPGRSAWFHLPTLMHFLVSGHLQSASSSLIGPHPTVYLACAGSSRALGLHLIPAQGR